MNPFFQTVRIIRLRYRKIKDIKDIEPKDIIIDNK